MKTKIQKTLALLLMLAMVLTVVPFGALASAAGSPVITPGATGSITVTKYATMLKAENDKTDPATEHPATGTEDDKITNDNYKPLKNAKFVLAQIYTEQQVLNYYNGAEDTLVLNANALVNENGQWKYNGGAVIATREGTTDSNGVFKFDQLPIGFYVLKEITAPEQITDPLAETCIISIPMVNTATSNNGENKTQDSWFYDVHVYPKNHEARGKVLLTKQDENGNGLNDVTFRLWKKELDANKNLPAGDWTQVTTTPIDAGGEDTLSFTTATQDGQAGKLTLDNLPAGLYGTQYMLEEIYVAPAEGVISSPEGYIINTKPLYFQVLPDNSIRWNDVEGTTSSTDVLKNENIGVTSASVSGTTLSITLKNERPSLEKKVKVNGEERFDTHAQYRMDETITYQLTVTVPANVTQMNTFTITDNPGEGIVDLVSEGCEIRIKDATSTTKVESGYSFATNDNRKGFILSFDGAKETIKGKTITISYSAKLTADAVIAGDGNENSAALTYSKYANKPESDEVYTITDHARVYTYEYQIEKQLKDATNGQTPAGVEFQLLNSDKTTLIDVVSLKKDASGTDLGGEYRLALVGETGINTMKTGSDGKLTIKGLKSQGYYLKETKTVAGYNLLNEPFPITVDVHETTTWDYSEAKFNETGLEVRKYDKTEFKDTSNSPLTNTTGTSTIINKKGFVLPQTGSMGYLLFCAVGLVLIAGGAALIFGGRKKKIR